MTYKFKYKNLFQALIVLSAFVQALTVESAWAQDDENYSGYDSIIRDLSANTYQAKPISDPMNSIRFHAGVGVITSKVSLDLPEGLPDNKTLRGFEARFGIDLFSPRWVAEGAVRTFDPEAMKDAEITMREFDLLVIYSAPIQKLLFFNIGGGMSARYLDVIGPSVIGADSSNTTPASVITLGISANLTSSISLGTQVSYRSPLVQDTIDKGSLDGTLRFAGHF